MHDSKLLVLLKKIDVNLHGRLEEFLDSPYFNKSQQTSILIRHILQFAPNYESEQVSKQVCFSLLYPRDAFEDVKIRRVMSKALKLLEQFVLNQQLETDELVQQKLWTDYYSKHDMEYFFQAKTKTWKKINKKQNAEVQFLQNYLMAYSRLQYVNMQFVLKNMQKTAKKEFEKELQLTLESLQNFYLFKTMYLKCAVLQQKKSFQKNIQYPFEGFIKNIEESDVKHNSLIHIYFLAASMLEDSGNEEKYRALKQKLETLQKGDCPKVVLIHLCKFIEGFLVKKCGMGEHSFYNELLDLYKYEIEHELVFGTEKEAYFYPVKFRNIVTVGLRVKDYEWIESFIEKYHNRLPKAQLPALHLYCKSLLCFHQKKYDEAEDVLIKAQDADTVLLYDIKRLQTMIYYEKNDIDLLDATMNAFRVSVFRDKFLSGALKEANQHFINMLFRIVSIQPNDDKKIAKMREELASTKQFMERSWLMTKVEERKLEKN